MTKCRDCGRINGETRFAPYQLALRSGQCADCCHKEYLVRKKDPIWRKKRAEYAVSWLKDLRNKAYKLLGDSCACCGEMRPFFLQIDHINNDGAERRRHLRIYGEHGGRRTMNLHRYYREIVNGKTVGLQILCANCNWGKARNEGLCIHEEERAAAALLVA